MSFSRLTEENFSQKMVWLDLKHCEYEKNSDAHWDKRQLNQKNFWGLTKILTLYFWTCKQHAYKHWRMIHCREQVHGSWPETTYYTHYWRPLLREDVTKMGKQSHRVLISQILQKLFTWPACHYFCFSCTNFHKSYVDPKSAHPCTYIISNTFW